MDLDTMDVADAVMKIQEKEAEVLSACDAYDRSLLELRAKFYLDVDPGSWPGRFAERLALMNKDYRKKMEFSLLAIHNDLTKFYADPATSDRGPSSGARRSTLTGPSSGSLMGNMLARVDKTLNLIARLETLVHEFYDLYDTGVANGSFELEDRVKYLRARPTFQKGLDRARQYEDTIQATLKEWRPYFEVIADKAQLDDLLAAMHAEKIPQNTFLEKGAPICRLLAQVYRKRDELVNEANKYGLRVESEWVTRASALPTYRVRYAMGKFDHMIEEAKAQGIAHATALNGVESLTDMTSRPEAVSGRDGEQINLHLLAHADTEFRELSTILDAVNKLGQPLIASLEEHITTMYSTTDDQ